MKNLRFLLRPVHVAACLFLLPVAVPVQAQQIATVTLPDAPSVGRAYSDSTASASSSSSSAAVDSAPQANSPSSQPPKPSDPVSKPEVPPLPADKQTPEQQASAVVPQHQDAQTKRILGILPNFRSVSADQKLPPQSVKEKFITASQDSFDYSSIALPLAVTAYDYGRNATPEFGSGGVAFGRYLWHSVVDQTAENYWVEFIVPAIAHEDTRFYTLGKGGFKKRAGYAISRIVITRSDSGRSVFNAGEVVGAALSSAETNAYYPSAERTFGNTFTQYGTNLGIDMLNFVFKEFWPDINHALFHGKADGN